MADLFFDANFFIDFAERKNEITLSKFHNHRLHVSPLSIHILAYSYRYKIPQEMLVKLTDFFNIVPLDQKITLLSLTGPTNDFEDNIQLHSASEADCNFFLTNDKKMLKMKFFGKAQIINKVI